MLEIRRAESHDAQVLAALDIATWSASVTPAPPRNPESPFFSKGVTPEDVLVAESDGEVLGYVMLHQPIPLPSHSHVLEINGLAVHPKQQGRGIGRFLVEKAKTEARRRGSRKLTLRVLSPNGPARRLYESCGFVTEGILNGEFVLDERLVDDVLMACRLDEDPPAT